MGRKIMIVCGSPNKQGNTNRIVGWVADAAREAGAEVEIVDAAHMAYKTNGCIACMGCQKSDDYGCVIDDDASPVIKRMPEADAVLMASPVYWHGPTAQLKLMLDRTFSLVKVHTYPSTTALSGKTFGVIGTAGGPPEAGLDLMAQTFKMAADNLDLNYESLLVPMAPHDPEELEKDADLKERAAALGRRLAGA